MPQEHNSKRRRGSCAALWQQAHRQARLDLRTRWRLGCSRFLALTWLSALFFILLFLSRLSTNTNTYSLPIARLAACQPNGDFNLYPENYRFWSSSGFFEITLGFGELSFTQVKVIDVTWDIACARGGQALLALISWHVFTNYVTTSMEVAPVTFSTYRSVFVRNESLLFTIPRLLRDFSRRRGLRSRAAMVFIISTLIFILAFPSLASAMTGYSANVKSYIRQTTDSNTTKRENSNYLTFSSFQHVMYIIHDGKRIGLSDDYVVPYGKPYGLQSLDPVLYFGEFFSWQSWGNCESRSIMYQPEAVRERCRNQIAVADYVLQYGFNGFRNTTSKFLDVALVPPVLNISAFYLPSDTLGANWTNEMTREQPFRNESRSMWAYDKTLFSLNDIKSLGACQPVETYKWGFSFIQLNIMLILCLIWTLGVLVMYIQAHLTMKHRGRRDVAGDYKAVLELADAMKAHLGEDNKSSSSDLLSLSESELRRRLVQYPCDGSISYTTPLLSLEDISFKAWLLREKWWIGIILATYSTFIILMMTIPMLLIWLITGFWAALVLAVSIGSSGRSRGILAFWGFIILCLIPLSTVLPLLYYSNSRHPGA